MCTLEKLGSVYILTLTGAGDEHRLNPTLIASLRAALAQIRSDPSISALVTTAEGKFFSNGFDLAWAKTSPSSHPQIMSSALKLLLADLFSLPTPTIAAVTGHASAAGLILALAHDYVFMRNDRGFLYMSEMDMGVPLPGYFLALLRSKISDSRALREVIMKAAKITAAEGVRMGLVDRAVEGEAETAAAAVRFGEDLAGRGWDGGNYAAIRKQVWVDMCRAVGIEEIDEEEVRRRFVAKL